MRLASKPRMLAVFFMFMPCKQLGRLAVVWIVGRIHFVMIAPCGT